MQAIRIAPGSGKHHDAKFHLPPSLALHPFLAIQSNLFLPDWHSRLKSVNGVLAGRKCFGPVWTGHDDHNAAFSDLQPSNAMHHRHMIGRPPTRYLGGDGRHLLLSHLDEGVVLQVTNLFSKGGVPYHAQEDYDPAITRPADLLDERLACGVIQRILGDLDNRCHRSPPSQWWNKSKLVSIL